MQEHPEKQEVSRRFEPLQPSDLWTCTRLLHCVMFSMFFLLHSWTVSRRWVDTVEPVMVVKVWVKHVYEEWYVCFTSGLGYPSRGGPIPGYGAALGGYGRKNLNVPDTVYILVFSVVCFISCTHSKFKKNKKQNRILLVRLSLGGSLGARLGLGNGWGGPGERTRWV